MNSNSLHSGAPTKHLPSLPQNCADHQNRGSLRACQSPEEPEETGLVWGLGGGLEQEKDISLKTEEIWKKETLWT